MANSITFHPVVMADHKRTDGSYNVKIRVTFKRVSRRLSTNLFAHKEDLTRSLTIKSAKLVDQCNEIIKQMQGACDDLNMFALDAMTVDDVVAHMKKRIAGDAFRLDFFEWSKVAISGKGKSSAINYGRAVDRFREYVGRDALDINEITSSMMRGFEDWLRQRYGSNARAVSLYSYGVAHIHALARRKYNDEESERVRIRNPFEYYKPAKQSPGAHRNIELSYIREMIADRPNLTRTAAIGVDFFLLSFFTMGTNLIDFYTMPAAHDGVMTYNRSKTTGRRADKAEMRVRIEPEAAEIIARYEAGAGDKLVNLWRRYGLLKDASKAVNNGLKRWCESKGYKPFTYYAARHTFGTAAYSAGINPAIITDMLCHVDQSRRIDAVYVAKDWRVMWEANRRVLDFVLNEEDVNH